MNLIEISLNEFLIYILVLLRMGGVVVFAPFLGGEDLPQRARIGIVVFLALATYHRAEATLGGMALPLSLFELAGLAAREVLVGVSLGYGSSLVFSGVQLAGELVGQQIGFTLANVLDPVMEEEVGLISFFKFTLAIAVFLALNLHLLLLKVLALSYEFVGLGGAVLHTRFLDQLLEMFGGIWRTALEVGGPVLIVMLMVSIVVGVLSRTMPQLNLLVIGLPTRTMVGLFVLSVAMYPVIDGAGQLCGQMLFDVELLIRYLGPGPAGPGF